MTRPLIALSCQRLLTGTAFTLEPGLAIISHYVDAVWRAGGLPMPIFPQGDAERVAADILDQADGVIPIGGFDVDPHRYGQEPHPTAMIAPRDQEEFEVALVRGALERGTPMLAICRGAQLLNVILGGSLHQHITGAEGLGAHGIPNGGGGSTNEFLLDEGSLAAAVMGSTRVSGRCHHHQAVDAVAPGLRVTGRTADGTVEVLELAEPAELTAPAGWLLAVQWHPEETAAADPANQALFDALVTAAS